MDLNLTSTGNPNSDYNSEPPMNHLSSLTTNSSNNNSLSSLTSRSISNRYYTLANISPASSFYFSGDEHNILPHNRQNLSQLPKQCRQIRNNIHNTRAASFLQQLNNSDDDGPHRVQDLLELSGGSSLSTELLNQSVIGVSYEVYPGQSFLAAREFESGVADEENLYKPDLKVEQVEDNLIVPPSQQKECFLSQTLNMDDLPYNWQASKATVKERISSMFNRHAMADVYFVVGRSPNVRRIPGHQFVLAISSAVFDAMFFGPLSAKKIKKSPNVYSGDNCLDSGTDNIRPTDCNGCDLSSIVEISVPDVDPVAFLALLRFIYTDEVHIGPDTVMTTLYAAKKYSITALEQYCVDYLRRNLCSDNAFMLLTQARLFNEVQLAHQCLDVIDKNTSEALAAEGFLDIDMETLCSVLDRDTLGIREVKLFQAAVKWAMSQLNKRDTSSHSAATKESPSIHNTGASPGDNIEKPHMPAPSHLSDVAPENCRSMLGPALQLIRFPLMSIDDFANAVAQTRILTDREMVDIFLYYLTNPKPSIAYKDIPRCCLTGKEQVVNRYPVVEQRWGYSGTSDRIRFLVDRKIFIVGFGLYGSAQGPSEYQVIIEILQQDSGGVLASNYLTFKCDGSNSTFRVRFKEPVEILANVSYIACATLKGPDSYYGSIGYQKVIHESATHDKVSFQFNYAAGNNNGTSVEDGQIPEIIFYM